MAPRPPRLPAGTGTSAPLMASVVAAAAVVALLAPAAIAGLPNPAELARSHGYDAEAHVVLTDDGYLLGMFRVRRAGAARGPAADRDPVLIVAGLACNAVIWVLLGPGKALAYLLADRGYDVWLGDYRGSMYSRRHTSLGDRDERFWNFSLDDIGRQDLPAMLRLVTRESGRPSVSYVGHSMGASVLPVMASERAEAALVSRAYLLAPAVFMGHVSEPAIAGSADAVNRLHDAIGLFSSGEIPLSSGLMRFAIYSACSTSLVLPTCLLINGMYVGHDTDQVNKTELSFYLDYLPDSMAVKAIVHFLQHFKKVGEFRRFDYGVAKNRAVYGTDQPPEYNLSRSAFPVSVYYGDNDFLVRPQDVLDFSSRLPNLVRPPYRLARHQFNHIDFFLAMDAKALLYDRLLRDLEEDESRSRG